MFDEHAELVLAPTMRRRVRDAGFAAADVRYRIFFPARAAALAAARSEAHVAAARRAVLRRGTQVALVMRTWLVPAPYC